MKTTTFNHTDTEELVLEDLLTIDVTSKVLILHNDDYNTFDWVIDSLIDVCKHSPEQAEQCAYIVHYTGKCDVKLGPETLLRPMYIELKRRGLSVTLED
jgi:ATP-dependent Clp protease adaptor protein ClpS